MAQRFIDFFRSLLGFWSIPLLRGLVLNAIMVQYAFALEQKIMVPSRVPLLVVLGTWFHINSWR